MRNIDRFNPQVRTVACCTSLYPSGSTRVAELALCNPVKEPRNGEFYVQSFPVGRHTYMTSDISAVFNNISQVTNPKGAGLEKKKKKKKRQKIFQPLHTHPLATSLSVVFVYPQQSTEKRVSHLAILPLIDTGPWRGRNHPLSTLLHACYISCTQPPRVYANPKSHSTHSTMERSKVINRVVRAAGSFFLAAQIQRAAN